MSTVMTYSPSDIIVRIEDYTLPGIMSIELKWDQPQFKIVRGIRGQVARVRNTNMSGTVVLTLQQTSLGNSVLQSVMSGDQASGNGRFHLAISEGAGNLQIESSNAFVTSFPDMKYSNNFEDRVWTLGVFNVAMTDSASGTGSLRSILDQGSKLLGSALGEATKYAGRAEELATQAADKVSGFF